MSKSEQGYTLQRYRNNFALVYRDAQGRRHRHTLGTADPLEAGRLAPAVWAQLNGPRDKRVKTLWGAYCEELKGRAIVASMGHKWPVLAPRFGERAGDGLTAADFDAHIAQRRQEGVKEWTIYTELGYIRNVLSWAMKRDHITKRPHVKRPPQPKTEKRRLTQEQVKLLVESCALPHIRLYTILIYATAARTSALLGLRWERVDLVRRTIDLRDPTLTTPHKGRAIVPINDMAYDALIEARKYALSEHVIEWAGKPIKKARRALATVANRAGLGTVGPHMLRHSAATHMAEAGVDMEEIRQYLGHEDIATTREIYAQFSPKHLRQAAGVLDLKLEKRG